MPCIPAQAALAGPASLSIPLTVSASREIALSRGEKTQKSLSAAGPKLQVPSFSAGIPNSLPPKDLQRQIGFGGGMALARFRTNVKDPKALRARGYGHSFATSPEKC